MSEHVTGDQLRRLRSGDLPPDELLAVGRHLAACADCALRSREQAGTGRAARELTAQLSDDPHPSLEEELFAYVDGTLPRDRSAEIEAHLEHCDVCRQDVEDARRMRRALHRPSRRYAWLAVAAVIVLPIFTAAFLLLRRPAGPPPPLPAPHPQPPVATQQGYGRADWDALVHEVLTARRLPLPPFEAELHDRRDEPRGLDNAAHAKLAPTGVVVESPTPEFRWPHAGRAYVVEVFDGERRIARSGTLHATQWTPSEPLPRGRTLLWQVRVDGGPEAILPAPPDPPARFRIADAESLQQIEEARQRFPSDHLLLASLYARAGLRESAARELEAYETAHPGDAAAAELRRSLKP